MYGQIMSIVDDVIFDYFELVTRVPMDDIEKMKQEIKEGQNPMVFKKKLAKEVVSFYHGENKALEAEENFENTFSKGGVPEDVSEVAVARGTSLVDILIVEQVVISKSEWRRLVSEGAVANTETGKKITDPDFKVEEGTYKIGKRRFIKIGMVAKWA